jgi:hypothetical protein
MGLLRMGLCFQFKITEKEVDLFFLLEVGVLVLKICLRSSVDFLRMLGHRLIL